jgi:glycerol-3-phosphate dehydrogenase
VFQIYSFTFIPYYKRNNTKQLLPTLIPSSAFDRRTLIANLRPDAVWDIIIIGGGATGLGIAVDAASRGFSTLLLEQSDFAKGTSSRSTKLVHGGVRYLAQGNIRLVMDALQERGLMLQNAPHLVSKQSFIIPCYSPFSAMKYWVGLKLYDWLSGRLSFGSSKFIGKAKMAQRLPGIALGSLTGGVEYFDGQFDDARYAVNLAQTCIERGGVPLNYCKVTGVLKNGEKISGVKALDLETSEAYSLGAKVVINATGVFVDEVMQMDVPGKKPIVQPSQGVHIVIDRSFLNSESALMIPETADGRVLFAVPWHDHLVVGTTDTPLDRHSLEPRALDGEVAFILSTLQRYINKVPAGKDVLAVFAGLRPLAAPHKDTVSTKEISRDHKLIVSRSGLITITGGKWTTYRKMAEQTVDRAIQTGSLKVAPCLTKSLPIHGAALVNKDSHLSIYGSDSAAIKELIVNDPGLGRQLVDGHPYTAAEVVWAVRYEMARTVEDVLARRLRLLFLDVGSAMGAAPVAAKLMAEELGYPQEWVDQQIAGFTNLARQYMLTPQQMAGSDQSNLSFQPASATV